MALLDLLAKSFVKECSGHIKVIDPDAFQEMVKDFLKEAQEEMFQDRMKIADNKVVIDLGPRTMFHIMRAMDRQMGYPANEEVDKYLDWAFNRMDLLSDDEIEKWLTAMVRKFRKKYHEQLKTVDPYPEAVFKIRCN